LQEINLQGTKWKLIGIVDTQTDNLTELEPIDCEKCYTFTFGNSDVLAFDVDSVFNPTIWSKGEIFIGTGWYKIATGLSTSNVMRFLYVVDYRTGAFSTYNVGAITEAGEVGDGYRYLKILELIQSFSWQKNELRLYYNDGKNYLKFKEIGGQK